MWIYLNDAFLSVVAHRDDDAVLLVRGRRPGDIERVFPEAAVQETPAADYRFRAALPRRRVVEVLAGVVEAGVEFGLAADLPVVERHEQHDVARHDADRELSDLAVHAFAARRSSRRSRRTSLHAFQRSLGVGSSGNSRRRRADESERRISSAIRT